MTKEDAILMLEMGEKVTHVTFMPHEWIKLIENYRIESEDGCKHDFNEFMKLRKGRKYLSGWSIFKGENSKTMDIKIDIKVDFLDEKGNLNQEVKIQIIDKAVTFFKNFIEKEVEKQLNDDPNNEEEK